MAQQEPQPTDASLGIEVPFLSVKLFWSLLALVLILYLLLLNDGLSDFVDNARYINAAKSLVTGQGYNHIYSRIITPQTLYPPGYPLVLAALMLLFSQNILVFKLVSVITTGCALVAFFFLLRRRTDFVSAAVITLLAGVSPLIVRFSVVELTEAPYLFLSMLALLFVEKSADKKGIDRHLWPAILVGAGAYYTKSAAIVLLPAAVIYFAGKKDFKKLSIYSSGFLALISPWLIRSLTMKTSANGTYLKQLMWKNPYNVALGKATAFDYLGRAFSNLGHYGSFGFGALPYARSAVVGRMPIILMVGVAVPVCILVITGLIQQIRHRAQAAEIYVLCYFAMYLLWPMNDIRFIHPVLPFILFYCFLGAKAIQREIRKFTLILAVALFSVSLLVDGGLAWANLKHQGAGSSEASLDKAASWLGGHSPKTSFILTIKPETVFLLSGRKANTYQDGLVSSDPDHYYKRILVEDFDYVVLDAFTSTRQTRGPLTKAIYAHPNRFKLVYVSPEPQAKIYRVMKQEKDE